MTKLEYMFLVIKYVEEIVSKIEEYKENGFLLTENKESNYLIIHYSNGTDYKVTILFENDEYYWELKNSNDEKILRTRAEDENSFDDVLKFIREM